MRIGILTFHTTPNFGATLQCYALVRHLQAQGHEVEVINYWPPGVFVHYRQELFHKPKGTRWNWWRILRFWCFVKTRLPLSGGRLKNADELATLRDRHDIVLVGSDEVWKVEPPLRPYDPAFFLHFANPERTRLASYAASSSTRSDMRAMAGELGPLLARFHALSVRDENTAAMVAELTGAAPVEVLDPTFLWDFGPETAKPLVRGDYLALYGWPDREQSRALRAFADARGLRLVAVGCRNREAHESRIAIGPMEWMRLVRHARYFVTDYFHGVAFAIHFRRPFAVFANPWKAVKIGSLLAQAGLTHRLFPDLATMAASPVALEPVDFDEVGRRLAPRMETSRAFLRDQITAAKSRG